MRVAPVPIICSRRVDAAGWADQVWPLALPLFVALDLAQDPGRGREVLDGWTSDHAGRRVWEPANPGRRPAGYVHVGYRQAVRTNTHDWVVDEPVSVGGNDAGPNPYDELLAALGTCTSITLRMYADRKGCPLQHVSVRLRHDRIHAKDCGDCTTSSGTLTRIRRDIRLDGPLTAEQRQSLMSIADKCPVHQVLRTETVIDTHAADPLAAPISA